MNAKTTMLAALALSAAAIAHAQTGAPPSNPDAQNPPNAGRHHRGPPPQAVAACDGKASGDACSFMGRENRAVSGTCFSPPVREAQGGDSSPRGERPMACRPSRGPGGKPGTKSPGG